VRAFVDILILYQWFNPCVSRRLERAARPPAAAEEIAGRLLSAG
jgi:hypothetical protein